MNLQDLRIVFMGTPDFAVASLKALVDAGAQIVGVITAPDKPAGRGLQMQPSAVKKFALEKGFNILQPPKLKDPVFLQQLKDLSPDVQVVVAFRMLPEVVWSLPPMGTINVHGSLLPQYRGAAPINWAVINGEIQTGVTTFQLVHEIDKGAILLQRSMPIGEDETAGSVHDRMMLLGGELLVETLKQLAAGTLAPQPQPSEGELKHAPKIFTDTAEIKWDRPAREIHNLIRGLSPFPGAFTHLDGKMLKIFRSSVDKEAPTLPPGAHQTDGRSFLRFATADVFLRVEELQLEGKKKMPVVDFLRGYRFAQ